MKFPVRSGITAKHCASVFARVRDRQLRVHCLTSGVAAERTANTLLALGVRPSLTCDPDDVAAFVENCDALLVNLGMMEPMRVAAIPRAIIVANAAGRPWVLDPVFVDVSEKRREFARTCIRSGPAILKVNDHEAKLVAHAASTTACVVTGATDRLTHAGRSLTIANGHPVAGMVTATGCALGAVIAAFAAVEPDRLLAATTACLAYGIAIEDAAAASEGRPGSFGVALIDALAELAPDTILRRACLT